MENSRKVKDKRYEERHKEERKAKCMVWGTSVPREKAERINEFLKKYGYTKVQLIEAGYEELLARHDTDFAKKTLYSRKKYRRTFCEEEAQRIGIAVCKSERLKAKFAATRLR